MDTLAWSYPPENMRYTAMLHIGHQPTLDHWFFRPALPNIMSNTFREHHKERLRAFREAQAVEQAPRQQIVSAIEPQYLEAFQNTATGQISMSVQPQTYPHQAYLRYIPKY